VTIVSSFEVIGRRVAVGTIVRVFRRVEVAAQSVGLGRLIGCGVAGR